MKLLFWVLSFGFVSYFSMTMDITSTTEHRKQLSETPVNNKLKNNKMKLKIDSHTFNATLFNNKTVDALKNTLPLTLNMSDLNSNEKYAQLSTDLPTDKENIGTIKEGDIMLWGENTLVIFYKSFKTSYQYTKLGSIENPARFVSLVGKGSLKVTFEMDED